MTSKPLAAILFLMLAPMLPAAGPRAQELKVMTEELPPLNYLDKESGRAAGFSTEIVRALLKNAGIGVSGGRIEIYPWPRACRILEENADAMLFSMTRTEARENKYKWVGPLADRTVWLWKLKSRDDIRIESLQDAKQYKIGGVYEFAVSKRLQSMGFHVEMTNAIEQNWRKLFAERIDLGTALEIEAAFHLKNIGRNFDELQRLVKVEDRYAFYIALNRNTPDRIAEMLQNALDDMKADGAYDKIKHRYLYQP